LLATRERQRDQPKTPKSKKLQVEEHLGHGFAAELICINTAMYLLVHKEEIWNQTGNQ
jgi:hypothetical protein